ncbi:adaptor protein MecA [Facklamia sp. 7083-14-GEN3]|uniref:adaptor protein MecA n=1 Tax=Facklamia sp. 7083-14-GEN3 TaxID=2973478 RepID=UPI00215D4BB8|nr:adaptor protein MecA [Facklamia sp. 7083-14-GEN3]MCR8969469.1 adaptor protein MecA [Facklamia sp. 7083-14-GEN3]
MEMEHINDNLIKVLIGSEDLEERGIDFLDLIGDQSRIEKFFYSILEEVDIDHHFHDSEAVTFQVIPNSEGLELYISRANVEELDEVWEDELTRRLKERKEMAQKERLNENMTDSNIESNQQLSSSTNKKTNKTAIESMMNLFNPKSDSSETNESQEYSIEEVIRFSSLDDFLRLAREIPSELIASDLYYMNSHYFLILYNLEKTVSKEKLATKLLALFEFGEISMVTSSVLAEHGDLLRKNDALYFFGNQF